MPNSIYIPTPSYIGRLRLPILALACGLLELSAAPTGAQTRTPYQEFKRKQCFASECLMEFTSVPVARRLEVTSVSCSYVIFPPAAKFFVAQFVVVDSEGRFVMRDFVTPVFQGTFAINSNNYLMNNPTFLFAMAGSRVGAIVDTSGATRIDFECKIAGHLVSLR